MDTLSPRSLSALKGSGDFSKTVRCQSVHTYYIHEFTKSEVSVEEQLIWLRDSQVSVVEDEKKIF